MAKNLILVAALSVSILIGQTPVPTIGSGGVVNAANYGALSPGSLASLFGTNLASAPASATAPLPTTLGGATVSVNGKAAPLIYVGPQQINFQIPWETAVGNATVTMTANGVISNAVTVPILAAAPGVFFVSGNPSNRQNQAAIQNSDYSLNTPNNPALAGTPVIAYLTGTGPVTPAASTGIPAPLDSLSYLTSSYNALLWPNPAAIAFAGLAPGYVGLTQMNVSIPPGLATGTYPLTLTVNGQAANTANVSVKANGASAPACAAYPSGFFPFASVGYVSAPNSAGDRLLVGNMSLTSGGNSLFNSSFAELQALPLPAYKNQQFCGTVTLAPGYTAVAYVPTAAERAGDFNPFAGLLLDPLANNTPFPGGIIPASRLPSPMAWRIAANLTPSNDSTRLSDMNTLQSAIALTQSGSKPAAMGSAKTVYVSIPDPQATTASGSNCASLGLPVVPAGYAYHCSGPNFYQKTDGSGWIPINFSTVTSGSPLGTLPIDPTNTASSRLYYTYTTNGSQYETTAVMESPEYKLGGTNDVISQDGGTLASVYEKGTKLGLEPLDYGDASLVGYWTFDEGTGSVAYDYSGSNNAGTWNGTAAGTSGYYSPGTVGPWAAAFNNALSANFINGPTSSLLDIANGWTCSFWLNDAFVDNSYIERVISKEKDANNFYMAGVTQGGTALWAWLRYGGTDYRVFSNVSGGMGVWAFWSIVYNNGTPRLYLNGTDVTVSGGGPATAPSNTDLNIGTYSDGGGVAALNNGLVDDVRIYNRALSAAEIQAMYSGGK
jgi:uncharacterized protein (TIGR03437 family)